MAGLEELDGTVWAGQAELWVDPLGDKVKKSACTLRIDGGTLDYTWEHEGAPHKGTIVITGDVATFEDSWHQPDAMACKRLDAGGAVFQVAGQYGPNEEWGWRIALCLREPTGQLVLQMTNVAPWGEEARAVRMTVSRGD